MRVRAFLQTAVLTAIALALFAAPALAKLNADGGEGAYGRSDDVVVTNFGYGLIIFFVALVTVLSIAQHLMGKRKQRK